VTDGQDGSPNRLRAVLVKSCPVTLPKNGMRPEKNYYCLEKRPRFKLLEGSLI